MATSQGIFGIAAYDVSSDKARYRINEGVRGRAMKATESVLIFDWTFHEEVMKVLRDHASATDRIFPAQRFNKEDAKVAQQWVRTAAQHFFDEVCSSLRGTVERAEREIDKGEIGVLDMMDRVAEAEKRLTQKVEDFFVALATFRLDDEFKSFRKAVEQSFEVAREAAALSVAKNSDKLVATAPKETSPAPSAS